MKQVENFAVIPMDDGDQAFGGVFSVLVGWRNVDQISGPFSILIAGAGSIQRGGYGSILIARYGDGQTAIARVGRDLAPDQPYFFDPINQHWILTGSADHDG